MTKVIIINDFDFSSSIGITFRDYEEAISGYGTMYSLIYPWKPKIYPGVPIYPDFCATLHSKDIFSKLPLDLGNYLNSRASKLSFRNFEKQIVAKRRNEIIHYSNYRISPFTNDERSVVTMFDLIYTKTKRFPEALIKSFLLRNLKTYVKFEHVISISGVVKQELIDYGFEGKITNIYLPVSRNFKKLTGDKMILRDKLGLPRDKVLILSVSTNRPGKNLGVMKELMHLMNDNYRLVRVGVPIGDSITFQNVTDSALNEIYNACDILVLPSTEEGFGRPIIEAFTTGIPVVASSIPVFEEVAGNAAYLVEPEPHIIKKAIVETFQNSSIFVENGLRRAGLFSFDNFSEELKRYYSSIS